MSQVAGSSPATINFAVQEVSDAQGLHPVHGVGLLLLARPHKGGYTAIVKRGSKTKPRPLQAWLSSSKEPYAATWKAIAYRGFCVSRACHGRLGACRHIRTRASGLTGFSVTESPGRCGTQPRIRILRHGGCRSTMHEAPMPRLRKQKTRSSS